MYGLLAYSNDNKGKSLSGRQTDMRQLANIYYDKHDLAKAALWYRMTSDLKDTLFRDNMAKQIAEMQTKYESAKKDKALTEKNAELARQKLVTYGSFAIIFLILIIAFILFINLRKINRLSKTLEAQKDELKELNVLKDRLFSIISHDLRSPISSLKNMSTLLKTGSVTQEEISEFSSKMDTTLEKTMNLMDNLLHWATMQLKGRNMRNETLVVDDVVAEVLSFVKEEAELKKISITEEIDIDHKVIADENMLLLVIRNLLTNALKFTPEGGTVSINTAKSGERIYISVSDTGIGMSPEMLEELNAENTIGSTKGTGKEKGYGLGLQLCREYAKSWGGKLEIASKQGEGSTFTFSIQKA